MKQFSVHVVQPCGRRSTPIGPVFARGRMEAIRRLHAVDRQKGQAPRTYRVQEVETDRCTLPEQAAINARLETAQKEAGI
jgi:hypothetical protein